MKPSHPESFQAVATAARERRGVSVEDFAYEVSRTARERGLSRAGTSVSSVQKHLAGNLKSSPSVDLMQIAAEKLGIAPEEFLEYRLAMARRALDETVVGPEEALERLRRIESRPQRASRAGREAQRDRGSDPRPAASPGERGSRG